MKNVILGIVLALGTTAVFAQSLDLTGDVSVGSRYLYRGVELNTDPTVGGFLKLDNILTPGLYVSGQVDSLSTTPLNSSTARSDIAVGFHSGLGLDGFNADVSLHRVYNPSIYASAPYYQYSNNVFQDDYTEARLRLSYNVADYATVYGEGGQILSSGFSKDTYVALGVETDKLLPDLTVGALVSGEHYRDAGTTRYNNSEIYASYKVWRGLSAEARYSFGGKFVDDSNIDNNSYVGLKYNF